MSWREDAYWRAASEAALASVNEVDLMFVPTEFLGLHERFFPLEYSWGICQAGRRVAWCCSKDDAHRLAPWVHEGVSDRAECAWSNEVFVLCGRVGWRRKPSSISIRHWQAWRQRVLAYLGGAAREARLRPAGPVDGTGPKVLLIGASGMGNVGDDLLAAVAAELLRMQCGARVWCSHSDVDPHQLRQFDAIVVGGGGLIYASRDGRNETQNLANYLKFGPICRSLGVPVAMLGVSDQDHADGLHRDAVTTEFASHCLPLFAMASTRDEASTALLRHFGTPQVHTGPDLLFARLTRAGRAMRPAGSAGARLAMAGELAGSRHLLEGLRDVNSNLCIAARQVEIDLIVMSDDDVAHAQRIRTLLLKCGASAAIEDVRSLEFDALAHLFSQYSGLITTRFHGLVLAAICGVPVLALDLPDGKKARLLRALSSEGGHLLSADTPLEAGVACLTRAVSGGIGALPAKRVASMARTMTVHTALLRAFSEQWAHRAAPRSNVDSEAATEPHSPRLEPLPTLPEATQRYRTASLVRAESDEGGSVGLCWAASTRETAGFGNLGDSLSAVIVCALSGRRVHHVSFDQPQCKLVAVGSIAHAVNSGEAVIWGSGVSVRGGVLPRSVPRTHYDVRAVRGEISAHHLRQFGIRVPEVYGDPVWFLPSIFNEPVEKKYELGVIPHIQDINGFGPEARPPVDSLRYLIEPADADSVVLINTWHEASWAGIVKTLRLILSCKRIVSQSFHGVVIAEAYRIPVLNFRQMPGMSNGAMQVDLRSGCVTDPRVWEFYRSGAALDFPMFAQRRDQRTSWSEVIRAIDERWVPFEYDGSRLLESFPLPLAHDPRTQQLLDDSKLRKLRF